MANISRHTSHTNLPSPFEEDGSLFGLWRDMDRLFEDFTRGGAHLPATQGQGGIINPAVDVCESDKGFELKAELPGVEEKDIDVEYNDGILSLKAERSVEKEDHDEKKHYHLMERSHGTFLRRFRLPLNADPKKVEASFENGVLRIFVPRPEDNRTRTRKIELKPTPTHH